MAEDLAHRVEHPYALGMVTLAPGRRRVSRRAVADAQETATRRRRSSATAAPASPGSSTRPTPSRSVGLEPPGRGCRAHPPLADPADPGARARRPLRGDESEFVPHVDRAARGGRPGHGPGGAATRRRPSGRARATTSSTTTPSGRPSRSSSTAATGDGGLGADPPVMAGLAAVASSPGPVHPDVDATFSGPGRPWPRPSR